MYSLKLSKKNIAMLIVNKTSTKITSELINTFNQELIVLVNEFRQLQDVTGSVVNNLEYSQWRNSQNIHD